MAKAKRRGRPRKTVEARQVAAVRPRVDHGTPELQMHRARLVKGGDPTNACHMLDILYARRIIGAPQREAGFRYLTLHNKVFGRPGSCARLADWMPGEPLSPEDSRHDAKIEAALKSADSALWQAGWQQRREARALIFGELFPHGMVQLAWVRQGLTALVGHFGLVAKAA